MKIEDVQSGVCVHTASTNFVMHKSRVEMRRNMPKFQLINEGWRFLLSDLPQAMGWDLDDSAFETVRIPHDWSVQFPYDCRQGKGMEGGFLQNTGIGWYRKPLFLGKEEMGKKIWLRFDGILEDSHIYWNGHEIGFRPYGYFPAQYDISDWVVEGANLLAVRVDCSKQPFTRWYNGSGIFRDVWLISAGRNHIRNDGVFVKTKKIIKDRAELEISAEMELLNDIFFTVEVIWQGKTVSQQTEEVHAGETEHMLSLVVKEPILWSPENPALYLIKIKLSDGREVLDFLELDFGIRKLEFVPQKGMLLNGKPQKLKGVCLHHDAGVVGAAVTETILRYRLGLLKKMGCNAIRTAHNPFSQKFYEVCDELGLMVLNEAFDGWEINKASQDYGRWFAKYHESDLEIFIRRDRNHACVIMWSIGNEVTGATVEMTNKLVGLVHKWDSSRPVTCGIQGTGKVSDDCRAALDIAGYNDGGGACFIYERDYAARPLQLMVATESPHTYQTRGFYRTRTWWRDKNQPRKEIENLTEKEVFTDGCEFYHSSYDNAGVRLNARDCWEMTASLPYLIGEFRWTGFDYYGESLNWPARNVGNGLIDTANIPKDHYYLYQAMWVEPEIRPVLHILPHWTHDLPEETKIPVYVYTNCEETELFLNENSLGKQKVQQGCFALYQIPYRRGKLTAKAYYQGKCVKEAMNRTAGGPSGIRLYQLMGDIKKRPNEPVEIRAVVVDDYGTEVLYAQNPILFLGDGMEIIGTENGDHVDLTPLTSHVRRTFYGKCMVLAKAKEYQNVYEIMAVALLGKRYFEKNILLKVAMARLVLEGNVPDRKITFRYRINDGEWRNYEESIALVQTAEVTIRIFRDGQLAGELRELFIRKKAPVFEDRIHGNCEAMGDVPFGPFADEITGMWESEEEGMVFSFSRDGKVSLLVNEKMEQQLGWWWYDFPVDKFEAQDYAGMGEIWFMSGEKEKIYLLGQSAEKLEIYNDQMALSTAFCKRERILLKKLSDYSSPS